MRHEKAIFAHQCGATCSTLYHEQCLDYFCFLSSICYYLMGLNDKFVRFIINLIVVLFVSNAAMSIGYFASAISPSVSSIMSRLFRHQRSFIFPSYRSYFYDLFQPDIAAVLVNITILPFNLFGGYMVKLSDTQPWLRWLQWISFVRYGFNVSLVDIFCKLRMFNLTLL